MVQLRLSVVLAGIFAVLLFTCVAYLPGVVSAQASGDFNPFLFGTSLSIGLSPQYPRPGDTVRVSAQASGIDLSRSDIEWLVDGKVVAHGIGIAGTSVVAGAPGSRTAIALYLMPPDGSFRTATATVAPTEVDLLMSSDSYTPPFYRGRALPSAGTNLIAQALARFVRADGTPVPDSDITYTWKRDGEVLGSLSGQGKPSAVIPVRHLFTDNTITVDAVSVDGTHSGEASVTMPSIQPVLDLYEDHPLYGVLYNRALGHSAFVSESEMVFVAVPYFAQAGGPDGAGLSYTWRVNGAPVSPSASSPDELTINADNSSGKALIDVEVTHATNFYLYAKGLWDIAFPNSASAQDTFHAPAQ